MFVVFRAESPVQSAHIHSMGREPRAESPVQRAHLFTFYGQRAPGREPRAESPFAESTSALYLFRESESKTQYSFVLRGCDSSILYQRATRRLHFY